MSKPQGFVLNVHLFPDMDSKIEGQLARNTKAAWQSSNTPDGTQKNIVTTMKQLGDWVADGTLQDGDQIELTGQITFTDSTATPMTQTKLKVTRNGKTVDTDVSPKPAPKAAADEDEDVPF